MKDNDRLPTEGRTVEFNDALVSLTRLGRFKSYEFSEIAEGLHKERFEKYLQNIRQMCTDGYGLYIWGKTGVGKTHAGAILLKELVKKGYTGIFITAGELIDLFFNNGDADENAAILERIRSYHILILDGLGDEYLPNNSVFVRTRLLNLLKERSCRKYTSTIVTSSLSPISTNNGSQLRARYGSEVADLFSDLMYPVQLIAGNFRAKRQSQMKELLS